MICDPWIDRSAPVAGMRFYRTTDEQRIESKWRREILRAANKCIAGPLVGTVGRNGTVHGEPVKYGRCERCLVVYARRK